MSIGTLTNNPEALIAVSAAVSVFAAIDAGDLVLTLLVDQLMRENGTGASENERVRVRERTRLNNQNKRFHSGKNEQSFLHKSSTASILQRRPKMEIWPGCLVWRDYAVGAP
jgi:hypothetical protein